MEKLLGDELTKIPHIYERLDWLMEKLRGFKKKSNRDGWEEFKKWILEEGAKTKEHAEKFPESPRSIIGAKTELYQHTETDRTTYELKTRSDDKNRETWANFVYDNPTKQFVKLYVRDITNIKIPTNYRAQTGINGSVEKKTEEFEINLITDEVSKPESLGELPPIIKPIIRSLRDIFKK